MALSHSPRRPVVALLVASALALGASACGGRIRNNGGNVTTETAGPGQKANSGSDILHASLSGAEEVPPGVKDGVGSVALDFSEEQICYDFKVTMGEQPTKAHIHEGVKGANGNVVVNLNPKFTKGETAYLAQGCAGASSPEAHKILTNPAGFYVNIHTEAHPDGALRGQLTAG